MTAQPLWAIKHWHDGFYPDTCRKKRSDAVDYFKDAYGISDFKWRDDVKHGVHLAVKVRLVEDGL